LEAAHRRRPKTAAIAVVTPTRPETAVPALEESITIAAMDSTTTTALITNG
jgi:hypothetical protein